MVEQILVDAFISLTSEPIREYGFRPVVFLRLYAVQGLAHREQDPGLHAPGAEQAEYGRSSQELPAAAVRERHAAHFVVAGGFPQRLDEQAPIRCRIVMLEIRRPPAPYSADVVEVPELCIAIREIVLQAAAHPPIRGARGVAGDGSGADALTTR